MVPPYVTSDVNRKASIAGLSAIPIAALSRDASKQGAFEVVPVISVSPSVIDATEGPVKE